MGWGEIREEQKGGVGRMEGGGWTRGRGSCITIIIILIKMIARALIYRTRLEHRALYNNEKRKEKKKDIIRTRTEETPHILQ